MGEINHLRQTATALNPFPALRACAVAHNSVRASQIRENLHVILCFSPMAPEFRNRARKFPAVVSCTVIDWFQPWPKEALASVGTRFMAKSIYLDGEGVRAGVEHFMINSFEGVNTMCTKVGRPSVQAKHAAHANQYVYSPDYRFCLGPRYLHPS